MNIKKSEMNLINPQIEECKIKSEALRSVLSEKLLLKQNLIFCNENNQNITKRLLNTLKDFENIKSDLDNSLLHINIRIEKHRILYRRKLNNWYTNRSKVENQAQTLPFMLKLKSLVQSNEKLVNEFNEILKMFEITKKQYNEMITKYQKFYKDKVCEFSEEYIKLKQLSNMQVKFENSCGQAHY